MSETPDLAQALLRSITRDEDGNLPDEQSADDEWLYEAVEAGARTFMARDETFFGFGSGITWEDYADEARAAILAALPAITGGVADAVEDYADAVIDLIDSQNGARLAFEKISYDLRNFGSEVTR